MKGYMFDQLKIGSKIAYMIGLLVFFQIIPTVVFSMPVQAEEDEVDVICWDDDSGEIQCETVENLIAECTLSDPEGVSDICDQVLESGSRQRPGNLIINTPSRR